MTSLFTRVGWLLGLCWPLLLGAQNIQLPHVSSQYLYQEESTNAPLLRLQYDQGKVQLHSPEGLVDFSQENLTKILADPSRTPSSTQRLLAAKVRLQAPTDLPITYFNDLLFWLRLGGCHQLYLAVQVPNVPIDLAYINIPIAPFPLNQKVYPNLAAAQKAHPQTSFLDAGYDWNWYFDDIKEQPIAYIPRFLQKATWKGGRVLFQEQLVNPMVFSSMVQGALLEQYASSYERATPNQYWSISMNLDKEANYQHFITLASTILEGYHLYWEDLAFAKYQKTYAELDAAERWEVQQAAPLLLLYYDPLQMAELAPLQELTPSLWSELER